VQVESEALDVERLAARFFGENEKALVRGAPRSLFFELWTKKEALGKCLGVGLSPLLGTDTEPLAAKHRLSFVTERIFLGSKTYTLAACASEPIQKI
jgi:phosphopantetheinyl transferase